MIRVDWALGLAVHGLLAKWIFSLISSLAAQDLLVAGGDIARFRGFQPIQPPARSLLDGRSSSR